MRSRQQRRRWLKSWSKCHQPTPSSLPTKAPTNLPLRNPPCLRSLTELPSGMQTIWQLQLISSGRSVLGKFAGVVLWQCFPIGLRILTCLIACPQHDDWVLALSLLLNGCLLLLQFNRPPDTFSRAMTILISAFKRASVNEDSSMLRLSINPGAMGMWRMSQSSWTLIGRSSL